ncbi:hypothetical protein D3C79_800360 [compost metagenome]
MQLAASAFGDQGHGIGMVGQVFVEQSHVAAPDKVDFESAIEQQRLCFAQRGDAQTNLRRVDSVRPLPHQAHDHCIVATVTDTGGRQGAVQADFDALHLLQLATFT